MLHLGRVGVGSAPAAPRGPTAGGGSQLVGGGGSSGLLLAGLGEAPLLVDHLVQVLQGIVQPLPRDGTCRLPEDTHTQSTLQDNKMWIGYHE